MNNMQYVESRPDIDMQDQRALSQAHHEAMIKANEEASRQEYLDRMNALYN